MNIVINCRPADIEFNQPGFNGFKRFYFVGEGVE